MMHKENIQEGGVYLSQAELDEYSDRYSVYRVLDVPDDDHPDVIVEPLYTTHPENKSGGESSITPSCFVAQLHDPTSG